MQTNTKSLLIGSITIASLALLAYTLQRPTQNKKRKTQKSKRKTIKNNTTKTFNKTPIDIHLVMESIDGFNAYIAADRKNMKKGLVYGSKLIKINN